MPENAESGSVQTARKNSGTETKAFICSTLASCQIVLVEGRLWAITCGLFRRQSRIISIFDRRGSGTYIDPDGALCDQSSFSAVFKLRCNQTQHVLATA